MTINQKYVIIKHGPHEIAILFPELMEHSYFRYLKPISAGFFSFNFDKKKVYVFGESVSLKLQTRPSDAELILSVLVGDTNPHKMFEENGIQYEK